VNLILGLETSCDECSASIIEASALSHRVLSLVTHSQITIHQPYGGVVPEIASRNHLESVNHVLLEALKQASDTLKRKLSWSDLSAVGVTNRPGLIGALLVGVSAAKALAYATNRPLVPVHHLEGHALSVFLGMKKVEIENVKYPILMAIVSGGHTQLYVIKEPPELWPLDVLIQSRIGKSIDDAAGEAFDKIAKVLGFPYPGGAWIEKYAQGGNPNAFQFPRALVQKWNYDFSFSGLKTSVINEVRKLEQTKQLDVRKKDLCASVQYAIIEALASKMESAFINHKCQTMIIVGGVAANQFLRDRLRSFPLIAPKKEYCTDNAAMIALATSLRFSQGYSLHGDLRLNVNAIAYPEV
jgi:N6-L-threonylcarbamoyladenine synthase